VTPAATAAPASPPPATLLRDIEDRAWFDRSAADLAPDLLGTLLVRDHPAGRIVGRIVEVEAYLGPEDLASHASRGQTRRNAAMFGPPGHLYVYLIYGLHHCLNIVAGPGRKPEAVLVRGAEIIEGMDLALARRPKAAQDRIATGPGNLAAAFGIDRSFDGADLLDGPVRLAHGSPPAQIARTPRIGVAYAAEWAERPLRFVIADDPHRSGR